jgi:hypothetical protein
VATNTRSERNLNSMGDLMNLSFDGEYNVHVVEPLTYNSVSGSLERITTIQGNGSLVITYDSSNNPTTIEKTIGSTTYTKTLTWTDGVCTAVSAWGEV